MRLRRALFCVCMSSLALGSPASAHIGVTPGLLVVGDTQTLALSVHNDLDRPMTGLAVSVPSGMRVVRAGGEWQAVVEDATATWTGGPLAPNTGGRFEIELAVDSSTPVGPVQLQAEQLYPCGASLPWPIPVTVIPGTVGEASSNAAYIVAVALIGLLALASIVALAWLKRRRGGSLQEQ